MSMYGFTIEDVANMLNLERVKPYNKADHIYVVCPFCGDRRGKMSLNTHKGVYNCFHCGASGNSLDLYIELASDAPNGSDKYKEAYKAICNKINGNETYIEMRKLREEIVKNAPKETERANENTIDKTYRALLNKLNLSEKHCQHLRERGLDECDMETYHLKSMPGKSRDICASLIKEGFTLKGVPGFFQNKWNDWEMVIYPGIICPVEDQTTGLIKGAQIRLDEPKGDQKYIWLSSSGRKNGVSSGAQANFLLGKDGEKRVVITEGILKAIVFNRLSSMSVIGVPGVLILKSLKEYLKRGTIEQAIEAYDMDKLLSPECDKNDKHCDECKGANADWTCPYKIEKRDNIARARKMLINTLKENNIKCISWTWDKDITGYWSGNFKGIDDYVYALNIDEGR